MTQRRPVLRPAVRKIPEPGPRARPGATGALVRPLVPTPVAKGSTLQTGSGLLVEPLLRPVVLATRVAGIPVLVVGLVASMATTTELTPAAVPDVETSMAAPASATLAFPIEVTVGRQRVPPARKGAVPSVLAR